MDGIGHETSILVILISPNSMEMSRHHQDDEEYKPFWKSLNKDERAKYDMKLTLDGTGAYHWREPCALDDVTMVIV